MNVMTRRRYDNHSTEFGLWLRDQVEIESHRGYWATNIDFVWYHCRTGQWLLIEEKRYMRSIPRWQRQVIKRIHIAALNDRNYRGFFSICFERTNPDDGIMWINNQLATKSELVRLLQFDEAMLLKFSLPSNFFDAPDK